MEIHDVTTSRTVNRLKLDLLGRQWRISVSYVSKIRGSGPRSARNDSRDSRFTTKPALRIPRARDVSSHESRADWGSQGRRNHLQMAVSDSFRRRPRDVQYSTGQLAPNKIHAPLEPGHLGLSYAIRRNICNLHFAKYLAVQHSTAQYITVDDCSGEVHGPRGGFSPPPSLCPQCHVTHVLLSAMKESSR